GGGGRGGGGVPGAPPAPRPSRSRGRAGRVADRPAGNRGGPRRSSQITTGPRTRVRRTARASGTKIRWPRYRAATTSPMLPRTKNARRAVATPGESPGRSLMGLPSSRGSPAEQGLDLAEQAGGPRPLGVVLVPPPPD